MLVAPELVAISVGICLIAASIAAGVLWDSASDDTRRYGMASIVILFICTILAVADSFRLKWQNTGDRTETPPSKLIKSLLWIKRITIMSLFITVITLISVDAAFQTFQFYIVLVLMFMVFIALVDGAQSMTVIITLAYTIAALSLFTLNPMDYSAPEQELTARARVLRFVLWPIIGLASLILAHHCAFLMVHSDEWQPGKVSHEEVALEISRFKDNRVENGIAYLNEALAEQRTQKTTTTSVPCKKAMKRFAKARDRCASDDPKKNKRCWRLGEDMDEAVRSCDLDPAILKHKGKGYMANEGGNVKAMAKGVGAYTEKFLEDKKHRMASPSQTTHEALSRTTQFFNSMKNATLADATRVVNAYDAKMSPKRSALD